MGKFTRWLKGPWLWADLATILENSPWFKSTTLRLEGSRMVPWSKGKFHRLSWITTAFLFFWTNRILDKLPWRFKHLINSLENPLPGQWMADKSTSKFPTTIRIISLNLLPL